MTDVIGIFAKRPAEGRVKTRLAVSIGARYATAFYEASLRDVVDRAGRAGPAVRLYTAGDADATDWFSREFPNIPNQPQGLGDLGERLIGAFDDGFANGIGRMVVIGSDSPTLPIQSFARAFASLGPGEVCIGPSRDGGYFLVGIERQAWPAAAEIFRGIDWSTERVLGQTIAAAKQAGLAINELEEWYDVDVVDDLPVAISDADPESHLARFFARFPIG